MAHVFVPSPSTAETIVSSYSVLRERVTVLRPGTEPPKLAPAPVSPPLILSVGIQHPRKGHDILLRALARLRHLDWEAVIAGKVHDASHAAELRVLREQLGLEARVKIAGFVAQDDLQRLYASATIFALATRFEGYGLVFDEALAHGLPIISCRTGAVPDTVPQRAGRLVAVDDPNAFAAALFDLLTDGSMRQNMAQAAALEGRRLPMWKDTARLAGQVLDRLCGEPSSK